MTSTSSFLKAFLSQCTAKLLPDYHIINIDQCGSHQAILKCMQAHFYNAKHQKKTSKCPHFYSFTSNLTYNIQRTK
ncbi:hypothetical protein Sjap_014961 [Stephania japonica]|uniref:Uncharacterized protein n=1 Tax=Stephania japonica TaxID=461633 RepID=A0AAP0II92_9MAGN